jgi:hypothetical protein
MHVILNCMGTKRIYCDVREAYPVFSVSEKEEWSGQPSSEVDEETLEHWHKAMADWAEVQEEIRSAFAAVDPDFRRHM